jgi:hypothetical protein
VVAAGLGVSPGTTIYLSYENFSKISLVHRDIRYDDYCRLPALFRSTETFVSLGRLRGAEFTRASRSRPIRAVIRTTRRLELFIVSVYRLKWPDMRRLYRRAKSEGRLIRDVETQLARQLMPRQ